MALPPQGKSLAAFQQEDGQCRNYAGAAIGAATGPAGGTAASANNAAADKYDLQTRYNVAYIQCMYSRGDTVQNMPPGYYDNYVYADVGYPWYDWSGPFFFGGNVFPFDNDHDFHHGFHHGFHEGFHGGFHGDGGRR
jgi:hypothetical protein